MYVGEERGAFLSGADPIDLRGGDERGQMGFGAAVLKEGGIARSGSDGSERTPT